MTEIKLIDPITFEFQQYSEGDESVIPSFEVDSVFSLKGGRVESFVYDLGGNLINYNPNGKYTIAENELGAGLEFASTLFVYPEEEVTSLGFTEGKYNVSFNFLNNELNSSFDQRLSLKEISANRKEVRLVSNYASEDELKQLVEEFFPTDIVSPTYPDFYLNFGRNNLFIANNCLFDNQNGQYSILVKLYDALPSFIQEGETLWVVTEQKETVAYNVAFEEIIFNPKTTIDLKGPNFSLPINNNVHTSIELKGYDELNNPSGISTSSYNQLQSILQENGVEINIDYTKASNFIHFSSLEKRVKNFYYKVGLIESASNSLAVEPTGSTSGISSSIALIENKITSIIENFDGFEYFLYYSSGAFEENAYPQPYPKTNSVEPYTLASTGSTEGLNWLATASLSGSLYDEENQDNLINTIPEYLLEDPANAPYTKFVEMIGQHFDTLFTYAQDITNRYNADNRLDFGISKDLVGEAIKSMGVELHTGNFNSTDLISSFIGINSGSSYLPPLESGQALNQITNYVTASNDPTPIEDVNKQIYKRIYHNLPLLLKKKGSVAGLRTLITTFGIPDDILKISEYTITGKPVVEQLPSASATGSIEFPTETVSLPPSVSLAPPSELLSPTVRVQQHFVKDENYDRSLHYVEAGFSPQNDLNTTLSASSNVVYQRLTTDPGYYIGDFNEFYFQTGSYYSSLRDTISSPYGGTPWNTAAFIRYVKFLDSSLFSMIKDFIPIRSARATGVIIKPTLQERSRQRPPQVSHEDLQITASSTISNRSNTALGSTGGSWNNSNQYKFSPEGQGGSAFEYWLTQSVPTPVTNLTQSWVEYVTGNSLSGSSGALVHSFIHDDQAEFYNGIFKQSGQIESRSSNTSNPTGHFQTDNNPQNPYKKALSNTTYGLEFKGLISNYLNIIATIAGVPKAVGISPAYYFFNQSYDSLFFNNNFNAGDNVIKDILEGNGSTLTLIHSGTSYIFNILSVSPAFGDVTEVAVSTNYIEGDRNDFIAIASGQAITFDPNWDPFSSSLDLQTNPGPFTYSDFNPLINNTSDFGFVLDNYEGIRKSIKFQDADYSGAASSSIIPINNDLLAAGSASRAAVQDSNYSSKFWVRSRYEGNRISSLDFNSTFIAVAPEESTLNTTASLDFDYDQSSSTPPEPFEPQSPFTSG